MWGRCGCGRGDVERGTRLLRPRLAEGIVGRAVVQILGECADVVAAFGVVFDAGEDVRGEGVGAEVGAGEGAGHGHEGVDVVAEGEGDGGDDGAIEMCSRSPFVLR